MTTTSSASFEAAARAATAGHLDRLRGGRHASLPGFAVELAFGDVLHDAVGHQVPQRAAFCGAPTAVGGRDCQRRDFDQCQRVFRQPVEDAGEMFAAQFVARPADPDEPRHREQFLQVLPRQDGGQRVGAGDEVQVGVGVEGVQIPQCVLGVGGPAAVDVDAADREAGVGRGGDHGHQVAVFTGADLAAFQPGLTGRHEHHFVEIEQVGHLAGRDQVAVVDGIERPTHHSQPPLLHGLPAYLSSVARARFTRASLQRDGARRRSQRVRSGSIHRRAQLETGQTGSSWSITAASCLAERHSCMVITSW